MKHSFRDPRIESHGVKCSATTSVLSLRPKHCSSLAVALARPVKWRMIARSFFQWIFCSRYGVWPVPPRRHRHMAVIHEKIGASGSHQIERKHLRNSGRFSDWHIRNGTSATAHFRNAENIHVTCVGPEFWVEASVSQWQGRKRGSSGQAMFARQLRVLRELATSRRRPPCRLPTSPKSKASNQEDQVVRKPYADQPKLAAESLNLPEHAEQKHAMAGQSLGASGAHSRGGDFLGKCVARDSSFDHPQCQEP